MKRLTFLLMSLGFLNYALCADWIVDPLGGSELGTFITINAALAAASPGDRIIVITTNGPVVETVLVDKSIEIVPAEPGSKWQLNGNLHISTLTAGTDIRISGMHQLAGGVAVPGYIPPGGATVSLADCRIDNGSIALSAHYLRVELLHDSLLNGTVTLSSGLVAGCYLRNSIPSSTALYVPSGLPAPGSDAITYIVGNDLRMSSASANWQSDYGIYWGNPSVTPYIANNIIRRDGASGGMSYGIWFHTSPSQGIAEIRNNTINSSGLPLTGVYVSTVYQSLRLFSNYTSGCQTAYSASSFALPITASYNHAEGATTLLSGLIDDATNVPHAAGSNTLDILTGALLGPAVDYGHPNPAYRDLDGTPNDPGAAGGSYSRLNFVNATESTVTAFVIAPTRVLAGETINVKAFGFAR